MTPPEKEHIVKALQFELSKVETKEVRQRMLGHLTKINDVLAAQVGLALGESVPTGHPTAEPGGTADKADEMQALAGATSPTTASGGVQKSPALSMEEDQPGTAKARKVAILAADGVDAAQVSALQTALTAAGAMGEVVGPHLGMLPGEGGKSVEAKKTFANTSSVLYDAVFVPGSAGSADKLASMGDARQFLDEAYKHGKPIAATEEGAALVQASAVGKLLPGAEAAAQGVLFGAGTDLTTNFLKALAQHRYHNRKQADQVAA